jgi:putative transposase
MALDYGELINHLREGDEGSPRQRKHRLPMACYASSECEYFLTLCARHAGSPFADRDMAEDIVEALMWRRQHHGWVLYCYCLMPDHLHFVVRLPEPGATPPGVSARATIRGTILEHVGRFKAYTTTRIWWRNGKQGPLWQRSSYDRVLRYADSLDPVIAYVLNNPVRKGLVEDWREYPYARAVDPW